MIRRIITLALFVALVLSAPVTRYNSMDTNSGSSPGGTACGHSSTYTMTGDARGSLWLGFPIGDLATSSSVKFYFAGTGCVNADKISLSLNTVDATATFTEVASGIGNECPFFNSISSNVFSVGEDCVSEGIDVTATFNAAKAANNAQLVFGFFNSRQGDNVNYCNRFVTPGVEPHFSDSNNCGLVANSHDVNPSSFYLVVEQDSTPTPSMEETCAPCPCGSTTAKRRSGCPVCNVCTTEPPVEATCAPCPCGSTSGKRRSGCPVCNVCSSGAPTTAAPSTVAPTHPTDCWTCPAGMVHYWEIEGATADDKCACYPDPNAGAPATTTTKAPAPQTTKAAGENISGNNNARSSAAKTIAAGSVLLVLAIAIAL